MPRTDKNELMQNDPGICFLLPQGIFEAFNIYYSFSQKKLLQNRPEIFEIIFFSSLSFRYIGGTQIMENMSTLAYSVQILPAYVHAYERNPVLNFGHLFTTHTVSRALKSVAPLPLD